MSTVEKALGLLEHLSTGSPEIGLSQFRALTDLDKGTLYRYLTSLKNSGFLEQNPETKAYRLGPAIIRLAAIREKTVPLMKVVAPVVDRIAAEVQELVHAALPQPSGMTTLYYKDGGNGGTRVALDDAEVLPFHATSSGLAYLSFADDKTRDQVLARSLKRYTPETPTCAESLKGLIAATLSQGYACTDQSYELDVCSVAVPFFNPLGLPAGTIAIATPANRMNPETRQAFAHMLSEASISISQSLGGTIPADLRKNWP